MDRKESGGKRKQTVKKVIITVLLICWIAFIFSNSMENGAKSSERSGSVTEFVNGFLENIGMNPVSEYVIRKTAHFSEYAVEGCLLLLLLWGYSLSLPLFGGWGLLGGVLTALTDESIQLFTSGRAGQVQDVWIDTGGVFCGMLFAAALLWLLPKVKRRIGIDT